jgi:DNA (cytosine-5)-methyltransferase 3A
MNVLSLFDGMSCGQIALERAGIKVNNYFASEIDPYAIKIAKKNYPDTIHLGDVSKIHFIRYNYPIKIDLLIGGSPCQDLSFANEEKLGLEGKKSNLFWEFVRLLEETKARYFLLENVRMEKRWQNVISKALGVEPIKINSSLVSAQSRNRLYWTNIPNVGQPTDKNLDFVDILEQEVPSKYFYLPKSLEYFDRAEMNRRFVNYLDNKKGKCVTANFRKAAPYNVVMLMDKAIGQTCNFTLFKYYNEVVRKLTPLECERLQTLPEGYTEGVSNTQRYAMIGNGWTIDVIAHIFKGMGVRLSSKKPTAFDVMAHQALHPTSCGVEPFFGKKYYRRKIIK